MVKVNGIKTNFAGVQHDAVQLVRESQAGVYTIDVLAVGDIKRIDGLEVVDFPKKHSTAELMHAYYNVNDMAERYLQTDDVVLKASLLRNMQSAVDSAL